MEQSQEDSSESTPLSQDQELQNYSSIGNNNSDSGKDDNSELEKQQVLGVRQRFQKYTWIVPSCFSALMIMLLGSFPFWRVGSFATHI